MALFIQVYWLDIKHYTSLILCFTSIMVQSRNKVKSENAQILAGLIGHTIQFHMVWPINPTNPKSPHVAQRGKCVCNLELICHTLLFLHMVPYRMQNFLSESCRVGLTVSGPSRWQRLQNHNVILCGKN